jgi:predicted TPR repeat methyltransferase
MGSNLDIWHATYVARTLDDLNAAYKEWAPQYDHDTIEGMGYVAPGLAAAMLDNYLESRQSHVLDAGCGTGLVGHELRKIGYDKLDAMDYSPEMLKEADKKSVYGKLIQADMNQKLQVKDDSYDATICVGALTYAHLGPHIFEELIRITRPTGYICFTIRDGAYQKYNYRKKMLELESQESWELQSMMEYDYLIKEGVTAKFCTYKVLEA